MYTVLESDTLQRSPSHGSMIPYSQENFPLLQHPSGVCGKLNVAHDLTRLGESSLRSGAISIAKRERDRRPPVRRGIEAHCARICNVHAKFRGEFMISKRIIGNFLAEYVDNTIQEWYHKYVKPSIEMGDL